MDRFEQTDGRAMHGRIERRGTSGCTIRERPTPADATPACLFGRSSSRVQPPLRTPTIPSEHHCRRPARSSVRQQLLAGAGISIISPLLLPPASSLNQAKKIDVTVTFKAAAAAALAQSRIDRGLRARRCRSHDAWATADEDCTAEIECGRAAGQQARLNSSEMTATKEPR